MAIALFIIHYIVFIHKIISMVELRYHYLNNKFSQQRLIDYNLIIR